MANSGRYGHEVNHRVGFGLWEFVMVIAGICLLTVAIVFYRAGLFLLNSYDVEKSWGVPALISSRLNYCNSQPYLACIWFKMQQLDSSLVSRRETISKGWLNGLISIKIMSIKCYCLRSGQISTHLIGPNWSNMFLECSPSGVGILGTLMIWIDSDYWCHDMIQNRF